MLINYISFNLGIILAHHLIETETSEAEHINYSINRRLVSIAATTGFLPAILIMNYFLCFISGMLVIQVLIDIKYRELSDRITFTILISIVLIMLLTMDSSRWLLMSKYSIFYFVFFYIVYLVTGGKIGGGDVKIAFIFGIVSYNGLFDIFRCLVLLCEVYVIYALATSFLSKKYENIKFITSEMVPSIYITFLYMAISNGL